MLFIAWQSHAMAASDWVSEKAYYEDVSATLDFQQVKRQPFVEYKDILNKSYSSSAFWVRIKLDAAHLHDGEKIAIKIMPTYLDEITLYVEDGADKPQTIGDRYPTKNNGVTALSFNFVTTVTADKPYLWLRLKTTSTNMMSVEAMTLDELNESNVTEYLLSGLLFGVLCAFAVLGASYFLTEKEVVNGTFFLKQLFAAMLAFVYLGYQRVLLSNVLSPETMDNLTSVCILFYTFLTLLFYRCFFTEYQPKKWVNIWFTLSMSLVGLALVLFSLGDVQQAMNLNMRVTAGASILLVMVPLVGIDWPNLKNPVISRRTLVATQFINLAVILYTSLPSLGLIDGSKFSAYTVMLNAVVSSLIMLLLVRYRAIKLDNERVLEIAVQASKTQHEKLQRERQEQFMAMLTHELKTPLALIRFAVRTALGSSKSAARIDQAVDDINAVIDRCQQVDKLEKGWEFSKESHSVQALIQGCLQRIHRPDRIVTSAIPDVALVTDAALFNVIVNNLIENALKYAPSTEWVYVDVQRLNTNHMLAITVRNKAGKAGAPDAAKVFDKYYRSEQAYATTGAGLGLYIVKSLTALLGGTVTYRFKDGFVNFEICLPL